MDMTQFFMANWKFLLSLTISTFMVALVWNKYRYEIGLFWIGFRQRFPLLGKVARLSKSDRIADSVWFHSEKQICQDWKSIYSKSDKNKGYYRKCKEYLEMVGESDRKPLTVFMMVLLFSVLVIEAFGFAYTLSGFLDMSASENVRKYMAYGVSIMFAVLLELFTHQMGHQIYRNKVIDSIRQQWQDDKRSKSLVVRRDVGVGSVEDPSDLKEPGYIKQLNRLKIGKAHKQYHWVIATVALIAIIAMSISYVRYQSQIVATTDSTLCSPAGSGSDMPQFGASNVDALYDDVPQIVTQKNTEAVNQGKSEICQATEDGSIMTIWTLGVMFCGLQVFATWAAITRGFVGGHSEDCYHVIKDFQTEDDYLDYLASKREAVDVQAQKSLTKLQQIMAHRMNEISHTDEVNTLLENSGQRTFLAYIQLEYLKEKRNEINKEQIDRDVELDQAKSNADQEKLLSDVEALKQENELSAQIKQTEIKQKSNQAMLDRLAKFDALRAAEAAQSETPEEYAERKIKELEAEHGSQFDDAQRQFLREDYMQEALGNA